MHKLALADLRHNLQDLLNIIKTFVGSYQMPPSPLVPGMQDMQRLRGIHVRAACPLPSRFALASASFIMDCPP
jgi:hypothetical protein